MASSAGIIAFIRARLAGAATPELRRKYERLVPGARVMGVAVPQLRELAKSVRAEFGELQLGDACAVLGKFAATPIREEMLVGIFLIGRFGKAVRELDWATVESWIPAIDNWEVCDQLSSNVAAQMVAANPVLVPRVKRLSASKNPWIRRLSLAIAADLSHAGRGQVEPAFEICDLLLADPDPMIQTALGWALREASKSDEAATVRFLTRAGKRMKPRTLRDAAKKLTAANQRVVLGGA